MSKQAPKTPAPVNPAAKPIPSTSTPGRETSPTVAAKAAHLLRTSDDADVRRVAASALSQAVPLGIDGGKLVYEPLPASATANIVRMKSAKPAAAFNVDDFRTQLPTLCATGTVGFNLLTRADLDAAVVVAEALGYDTTVDVEALRVEVRRRT